MNTMSRSRRYDEPKMPTRPRATTTPITMSIVRSGTSPSHMTARMPTTQIMAVPRSDWGPRMMSTGARTSRPTSAKGTNVQMIKARITPATANLIWLSVSAIGSTATSVPAFAKVMTAEVE